MTGLTLAVSVLDFKPKWNLPPEISIVAILYSVPSLHSMYVQYVPDGGVPPTFVNARLNRVMSIAGKLAVEGAGEKPVAAAPEGAKKAYLLSE